jgi:hypothetical protein
MNNLEKIEELRNWVMNGMDFEWWSDGHESFINHGTKLLEKGIELDYIKSMLSDIFDAVTNEYGDL